MDLNTLYRTVIMDNYKNPKNKGLTKSDEFHFVHLNNPSCGDEMNVELKIVDGYEDMMQFTAGTGEVDGQWIRNKFNVGIARSGEDGYTLDAFGTAF